MLLLICGAIWSANAVAQTALIHDGFVSGSISAAGEQDEFTFDATAGEAAHIRVVDTNADSFSPRIWLYNPDGTLNRTTSSGTTAVLDCYSTASLCRLNQTGTYRLVVADNGGTDTGSYEIHYARVPETNENGSLVSDGVVSGDISVGDIDSFVFDATAGEAAHIRVVDTNADSFSPRIWLYNPDGTLNRTTSSGTTAVLDCYSTASLCQLNQTGTYRLVVADDGGTDTGSYEIHYARVPETNENGSLVNDGVVSGGISVGDINSFVFDANGGEAAHIRVVDTNADSFSPRIWLYNPDGTLNRTTSSGTTAVLDCYSTASLCRLNQTGTYRLVVTDNGGTDTGSYEIHYARVPETNENGSLVSDGVVSGDISVGDIDSFVFDATAGEAAHIRVVDTNADSFSPRIWLYNPDGTLNRTTSSGTTAVLDCYSTASLCRLNQTGTYRLVVADNGGTDTGSYEISFNSGPCDPSVPVTGYVTDALANNAPLAGVTVTVGGLTDQTDVNGNYEIAGLSCATYTVSIAHGGYVPYERTLDRFARSQLNIALTKESTVNGTGPTAVLYGDPVNTATGNYVYQRRDLEIPGIGMALQFDRAYNSREASKSGAASGPLGYGWTHSYDVHLGIDAGIVTITWGDGHTETFTRDGLGGYTPQYGVFDTLADNGDGTYTLTKRDRTAYNFDTSNRLSSIVDKNGNTLSLVYAGGNLTEILDTAGRSVSLDHDRGRLTLITDPIGRTVQYAYDANGDLISATDTNGNVTQYTYDASHQILTVVDPRGNTVVTNTYDGANRVVTYQTDAKGNGTTFAYQELDRITTITDALGNVMAHYHDELLRLEREEDARGGIAIYDYDTRGNRVQVTDKNGNVTRYDYDLRGNVTRKTDALGNVTEITYDADDNPLTRADALGYTTTFTYDANGNLTQTEDALGGLSTATYDTRGLPLTLTDPNGNATTNAYDAEGNRASVTDALGNARTYTYDGVGRRLTETDALGRTTTYAYDLNDNLVTVTDALGQATTHTYDGNDNKAMTTDRTGAVTTWTYDVKDLVASWTDALGNATNFTYDALDRVLTETDPNGSTTTYEYDAVGNRTRVIDALGHATDFTYDLNGNRVTRTDARGSTTTFTYDALDRLVQTTDALGNSATTAYDVRGQVTSRTSKLGQVTQSAYDALGRLVQVTDAAGQVMTYTYDAAGNRLTTTDANGNTTQTAYDALNRPETVTDPLGHARTTVYDAVSNSVQAIDALGNTTSRTYDALDRVTEVTDALGNTAAMTYDAEGRVLSTTDANGQATTMAYDLLGRLTQVTDAEGGVVSYTYDAAGNRLGMTDPNGQTTSYAYDILNRRTTTTEALGHVTSVAFDAVGNRISRTDANGVATQFGYDTLNRLTAIDYPTDPDVAFTYNAVGNRLMMTDGLGTTSHTYDILNRRISTNDPYGNTVQYAYDPVGNRTSLTYPDGKVVSYGYDANDRLTTVTDWLANVTTYAYGADNRLVATTNANGTTVSYSYDAADRLTALSNEKSDSTIINAYSYTLDAVGNTLSEDRTEPLSPGFGSAANDYSFDAENRLVTINAVANAFDANGNQTGNAGDSYSYDAADRLTGTTRSGVTNSYGYDGLGNRYTATRDGQTTRYVLDTNSRLANVLVETDNAGTPQAYQVYGNGLIARILPDNTTLQYHYDSRGSTVAITDPAQALVQQYVYDPFGRTVADSGSTDQPYRYLGQHGIQDEGGALSYVRVRYYDADQQRFMNKDGYRGEDARSQTLNRYIYALNNPVLLIDITGYVATEVIRSASNTQGASGADPFVGSLIDEQPNFDAMPDFSTVISIPKTLVYGIQLVSKSGKSSELVSARERGEDDFKTLGFYKLCDADQPYDSFMACKASYATGLDETIIKVEGIESGASALGSCLAASGTGGAVSASCAKELADFGTWSVKYKSGDIDQPTSFFEAAGYATGNEKLQRAGYYYDEAFFWGSFAGKASDTYALGRQLDQVHVLGSSITDGQKLEVLMNTLDWAEAGAHGAIDGPRY